MSIPEASRNVIADLTLDRASAMGAGLVSILRPFLIETLWSVENCGSKLERSLAGPCAQVMWCHES